MIVSLSILPTLLVIGMLVPLVAQAGEVPSPDCIQTILNEDRAVPAGECLVDVETSTASVRRDEAGRRFDVAELATDDYTMLEEAEAAGQDVRYFGGIDDDEDFAAGQFLRPSLVINADASLSVVKDEQFGPTLPVIAYDREDAAVAMANDSDYGLSSSVWSADPSRAVAVARRLEAGFTNINSHGPTAMDGLSPFGGVKQSGIGRNFGPDGVRQFQEVHSISGQSGQIF